MSREAAGKSAGIDPSEMDIISREAGSQISPGRKPWEWI